MYMAAARRSAAFDSHASSPCASPVAARHVTPPFQQNSACAYLEGALPHLILRLAPGALTCHQDAIQGSLQVRHRRLNSATPVRMCGCEKKTAALCRLEAHLALAVSGFQRKATLMVHQLRVQALHLRSFEVLSAFTGRSISARTCR
jgi:hypothetical protein